jgi:hypothetical protein
MKSENFQIQCDAVAGQSDLLKLYHGDTLASRKKLKKHAASLAKYNEQRALERKPAMKSDVYKVTIGKNGTYHTDFLFVGRKPTKKELLEAIKRRLDESRGIHYDHRKANDSTMIVEEIGIPDKVGVCQGTKWFIMGIEMGEVEVRRLDAWTLGANNG